jgi:HD-like signal output (HDOD) protein/DNA-binding NarL/FixJ family response regulator
MGTPIKILVVDDMSIFRDPIAASLRLAGFESLCASNGQEALQAIRAHRPAVVLLDVSMPVMDGISCLRALRGEPEIARTPVILFTALSDRKYVLEAGKLGVQDYLLKSSFSLKDLLARVVKYTGLPARPGAAAAARPVATPAPAMPASAPPAEPAPPLGVPAPSRPASGSVAIPLPQLLTREQCVARAVKALAAKTLSGAVAEVISLAASPRGSVSDLAPLIARDPLLSARVLQAANSAAYVSSRAVVSTIPDAVRQIGLATVRSIAAALGIFDVMPPSAPDGFNPVRCWQHSFAVAMLCERLVPKDGKDAGDAGLAYLVGLCHDLGDVLFHTHFGKEYAQVIETQRQTGRRIDEVERAMLGMTRGELVQTIIQCFGLPDAIKDPIRAFHDGHANPSAPGAGLTRVLRLAEVYANGLLLASSGRSQVAPITRAECKAAVGREEPRPPDVTTFRSEVLYTTAVLARLSDEEAKAVMKSTYERTPVRLCVVREAALTTLDPVTAALESMAEVKVVSRLADLGDGGWDGVVLMAPSDLTAGFTAPEVLAAAPAALRGGSSDAPRVLWLVGRINGMVQRGAAVVPQRWPIALDDLARFVRGCDARGSAPTAAAA